MIRVSAAGITECGWNVRPSDRPTRRRCFGNMERWRCAMNARLRGLILLAPALIGMSGCEWFTDFKRQPSLWTWEPVKDSLTPSRGNPQYSVPVTGMTVAAFQVSYSQFPATIDSMAALRNPTAVGEASLHNGRMYYRSEEHTS